MVHYNENNDQPGWNVELSINDAAAHALLLKAIVGTIRMAMNVPKSDMRDEDSYNIVTMCDLLEAILPDEWQLNGGMEYAEKRANAYKQLRLKEKKEALKRA